MDVWKDFPTGSQGLYGTDILLLSNGVYSVVSGIQLQEDPDPNVSGIVMRYDDFSQDATKLRKILPTEQPTVGIAIRQWKDRLENTSWAICFNNIGASRQVSITTDSSGRLVVKTGTPRTGPVIGSTPMNTIVLNAWQNIEFMATRGNPTGSFEVRVEGVSVLTIAGVNTGADLFAQVEFTHTGNNSGSGNFFFKDLRIWDGSGGWGDTFPGNTQVIDLGPVSDVSSGWSKSTGTSDFAILDNVPPIDAQFIFAPETPSIPAPAIVGLSNLPEEVTSVRSLMTIYRGKKSDGGDANVQTSLISNGLLSNGANRPVTTAFTYYWDMSHLDPNTGAPWTPPAVDAVQLRINRTV